MHMKKIVTQLAAGLFLFLLSVTLAESAQAASLKFSPTSSSPAIGETFQIQVVVDAGTDEVSGTDAYVLYDSSLLEATAVTEGTYFPYVTNTIETGKVSLWGVVTDPATSRTGTGTLATITFKALKNGSGTVSYYCDLNANDTSKIVQNDINATNIIVCGSNGTVNVTVGSGGGGGGNPTATPTGTGGSSGTSTPTPTGPTNTPIATELPRSGVAENLSGFAVSGAVLFIVGGVFALLL